MAVKAGLHASLKDLGTLSWQDVIDKGLYSESLLLNKLPQGSLILGSSVEETISNSKDGYKVTVILDESFLRAKMQKHICKYFNKSQEKLYLEFCKKVWEEYQNAELEEIVKNLIAVKGGTKEEWLSKLK